MPEVGSAVQLTKSAVKEIRAALQTIVADAALLEELLPKNGSFYGVRLKENEKSELCTARGEWLCVRAAGRWLPPLQLLQRYPALLPRFQVDRGAVPHVLNGANIMAQGLLSSGGAMDEVEEGAVVLVFAEGKTHPLAVGLTLLSTEAIRREGKGHAVKTLLVMGDELWDRSFPANRK